MFLDPIQKRALSRSVQLEAVYLETLLNSKNSPQDFFAMTLLLPTLLSKRVVERIEAEKEVKHKVQPIENKGFAFK